MLTIQTNKNITIICKINNNQDLLIYGKMEIEIQIYLLTIKENRDWDRGLTTLQTLHITGIVGRL